MTKDLFRFRHRPYAASPNVANYVPTESSQGAIDAVTSCVRRAAGPAAIIGASGLGKSMLAFVMAQQLQTTHQVVMLATSRLCTRRALLQNVLFELGLPYRDKEEGELRLGLLDFLRSPRNTSEGMLLIVDEANTMPARLLEEVRGLTNILRDGRPRVHLVLIGSQSFDERLAEPELNATLQRISVRRYLTPMTREETRRFVTQQWAAAIADGQTCPFDGGALDRLHDASEGVPRLVNQTCDHALMLANARRWTQITSAMVEEAWADLQQMPNPWMVNRRDALGETPRSTVIEFGMLEDEPHSSPSSYGNLERDSLTRLEEMRDLARLAAEEGILDVELADSHLTGDMLLMVTPVEVEPLAEDPFAATAFDEEEWVVGQKDRKSSGALRGEDSANLTPESSQMAFGTSGQGYERDAELESLTSIESLSAEIHLNELAPLEPSFRFDAIEESEDPFALGGFDADELLVPRRSQNSSSSPPSQSMETPAEQAPKDLLKRFDSADDKDLIVIEDPVPRNPLRVVPAPVSATKPTTPEPPAPAVRVEYQELFARLRGSGNS